jgi:hypothetical protein
MTDPTAADVWALAEAEGWTYSDARLAAFAIELGTIAAAERDLYVQHIKLRDRESFDALVEREGLRAERDALQAIVNRAAR